MRILVTGANGFIGRHTVAEAAAAGHDVLPLGAPREHGSSGSTEQQSRITPCHVDMQDTVRRLHGVDAVIHLAGNSPRFGLVPPTPLQLFRSNAELTAVLLEACAQAGVPRFVLASTSAVYAGSPGGPLKESQPLDGRTPYAASKIAAEAMVRAYTAQGALRGISLRLFNVYGPGQCAQNVCATIALQALGKGPVRVHDDRPVRDFIYVADVARALVAAATRDEVPDEAVNIGSGQGTSIRALAGCILRAAGRADSPIAGNRSASASDAVVADIGLATRMLEWRPTTSLVHGIDATLNALRGEGSALQGPTRSAR